MGQERLVWMDRSVGRLSRLLSRVRVVDVHKKFIGHQSSSMVVQSAKSRLL